MEDKLHVLQCKATSAQQLWELVLQQLKEWLKRKQTAKPIIEVLITGLQSWSNQSPNPLPLNNFWQAQAQIGWDYVLGRWLAHKWSDYQARIWAKV